MKKRWIWVAVGVAVIVVVTVVVVMSQSKPKAQATTTTSTTSPILSTTSTLPQGTTIPYSVTNNARRDVSAVQPCTKSADLWYFHGTVRNSRKTALKYQLIVDFVTLSGGTVLDEKIINISHVAPAATKSWATSGAPHQVNVGCVLVSARALPVS